MLRQSVLHLAVWRPQHLDLLLDHGFNVNARDWNGRTPLIYAAAVGEIEVAISLIKAGADLWVTDNLFCHNDFMNYAKGSSHWTFIMSVIDFVRQSTLFSASEIQHMLNTGLILWAQERWKKRKQSHLRSLLQWGADPEVRFTEIWVNRRETSNTILHCIATRGEFDILTTSNFSSFNHPNSSGAHGLLKIVERNNPLLLEKCIEKGSCVNHQDHCGRAAPHVVASEIWDSFLPSVYEIWDLTLSSDHNKSIHHWNIRSWMLKSMNILLRHNASPCLGDLCRCACSSKGCLPIHIILKQQRHQIWAPNSNRGPCALIQLGPYIMGLEWLHLVNDIQGFHVAKSVLLDMIRLVKFESLELTHTCCRKVSSHKSGLWPDLEADEVDEIMDEEKDLILILEKEMEDIEKALCQDLEEIWLQELTKLLLLRARRYWSSPLSMSSCSLTVSKPCQSSGTLD